MYEALLKQFESITAYNYPNESAAVVVEIYTGELVLVELPNIHPTPQTDCAVSTDKLKSITGIVREFWHSHTNGNPYPSDIDKASCENMGIPWRIFAVPGHTWFEIKPIGYRPPLVGRPWCYGLLDCAAIILDVYALIGVELPNYERPPLKDDRGRYSWHKTGWSLYRDNLIRAGFQEVKDTSLKEFDVILFRYQCHQENHAGVYISGGYLLHHVLDQKSSVDLYGGSLIDCTSAIFRYPKLTYDKHINLFEKAASRS